MNPGVLTHGVLRSTAISGWAVVSLTVFALFGPVPVTSRVAAAEGVGAPRRKDRGGSEEGR